MNIKSLVKNYMDIGYEVVEAESKVCQDIILLKIAKSRFFKNVTIKGGVVIHSISRDMRRATRDLDLDFIKYSLDDESIKVFIKELNSVNDGIKIEIIGVIMKLHHQDYDGKRVNIEISDKHNNNIKTKLDIGVHRDFDISQEEYCFDLNNINKSVTLLINSKEQIFTEKLKSLLKFGFVSTRYKDIFDFYYLIKFENLDKDKLLKCFEIFIYEDESIKENNLNDIFKRLNRIFHNKKYLKSLDNHKNNWLELPIDDVVRTVLEFFDNIQVVEI